MSKNSVWSINGTNYKHLRLGGVSDKLDAGIYVYHEDIHGPYLTKIGNEFKFDYKIYGIESEFINHVLHTINSTQENLGILLNGAKGTGKTVTAKLICNKLNLPVILVTNVTPGLLEFLNDVKQELIVFFDEYEKLFDNFRSQETLLPIMDGALNSVHKRVFILTTNELRVNANMLDRPSRIRYLKTFKNLTFKTYESIVDDKLIHKEFREDILNFIATLESIVVDAVITICEEVNIHKVSPEVFKEYFNVSQSVTSYDLYLINPHTGKSLNSPTLSAVKMNLSDLDVGDGLYIGNYLGVVTKIFSKTFLRVNLDCDVRDIQQNLILQDLIKLNVEPDLKERLNLVEERLKSDVNSDSRLEVLSVLMKLVPIYDKSPIHNLIY